VVVKSLQHKCLCLVCCSSLFLLTVLTVKGFTMTSSQVLNQCSVGPSICNFLHIKSSWFQTLEFVEHCKPCQHWPSDMRLFLAWKQQQQGLRLILAIGRVCRLFRWCADHTFLTYRWSALLFYRYGRTLMFVFMMLVLESHTDSEQDLQAVAKTSSTRARVFFLTAPSLGTGCRNGLKSTFTCLICSFVFSTF